MECSIWDNDISEMYCFNHLSRRQCVAFLDFFLINSIRQRSGVFGLVTGALKKD